MPTTLFSHSRVKDVQHALLGITSMVLVACSTVPPYHTDSVLTLPGIQDDTLLEAIQTFNLSCEQYKTLPFEKEIVPQYTGPRAPAPDRFKLIAACNAASSVTTESESRTFFETYFKATPLSTPDNPGVLTAYFESVMPVFTEPVPGKYDRPIYSAPDTLSKGQKWFTRKEIETGAADADLKERIIGYTDRWSLYVLGVQGSGIGTLPNGKNIHLVYSGKNEHPYYSIGKILIQKGEIPKDHISMQTIQAWLEQHSSEEQDELYWSNPSFVFHAIQTPPPNRLGPPGAMSLKRGLTPMRSAAVDWEHITPGLPLFVTGTVARQQKIARVVIAQDRGGAINGKARMDLYLGTGSQAESAAGMTLDETMQLWRLDLR